MCGYKIKLQKFLNSPTILKNINGQIIANLPLKYA